MLSTLQTTQQSCSPHRRLAAGLAPAVIDTLLNDKVRQWEWPRRPGASVTARSGHGDPVEVGDSTPGTVEIAS